MMAVMKPSLTLVIAVYNSVRYLEFIFEALKRQSFKEFEVIIADDGSGPEIKNLIERVRPAVHFPIQHLRQEDAGFRKNVMLNKSIAASQAEYLVFIDGDCVPHHKFLNDHWTHRKVNGVMCGRRVNLSKPITDALTLEDITSGRFETLSLKLLWDGLMSRSSNLEDALRFESNWIRVLLHWNQARILGCNFSIEKKQLEKINGFNEDYKAPGLGEDTDIAYRLELIGVKQYPLRYLAPLYHLYHPQTRAADENKQIFERVVANREAICPNGLRKLS
ncbi:MAG: glycosyltransferase [Bacteroidetes bacterium]|nr:MAG: glycosyltransferase [Bacteroidota bacterium]